MKIQLIGEPKVIMQNPDSKHNYFAWPSLARNEEKIIVGASGYRLGHICPFGKTVIAYSTDEGETYTAPIPVIDTILDDRDAGILCTGNKVIVTSFNNTVAFQRKTAEGKPEEAYRLGYLDLICKEEEEKYVGSLYRISYDGGVTFGKIRKSPITSPHGPIALNDGRVLWIGREFDANDTFTDCENYIKVYEIKEDETMEYIGAIENIGDFGSCEPDTIQLPNGRLICHIRVQEKKHSKILTIYQSESDDFGKTWTTPHQILADKGGAPAHLLMHSSGALLCLYGYRQEPYGIRAMVSYDNGETWDIDNVLYDKGTGWDVGYPMTVELKDHSLLTAFYAHYPDADSPAVILQQKWRFEK